MADKSEEVQMEGPSQKTHAITRDLCFLFQKQDRERKRKAKHFKVVKDSTSIFVQTSQMDMACHQTDKN